MATQTYVPIATTTLGSASSTFTFSSIPSTYTDLKISFSHNYTSSSGYSGYMQFNGDTGNNYGFSATWATNGGKNSSDYQNNPYIQIDGVGLSNSNQLIFSSIDIFSYKNTAGYKTALINVAADFASTAGYLEHIVGTWRSFSAITSVTFYTGNTFTAGSTATLWGI